MAEQEAISKSIEHWEKMIEWVAESTKLENPVSKMAMVKAIDQNWYAFCCSLCNYHEDVYSNSACDECALALAFGKCTRYDIDTKNNWGRVDKAQTWGDWLAEARILLQQLESLKTKDD